MNERSALPYAELFTALSISSDAAALYLRLLEHSGGSAGRLATLAGFKRGHTYNLLHELVGQGLVHEVEERGVKRFRPVAPRYLETKLIERLEAAQALLVKAKEVIPLLNGLMRGATSGPRIQVFKGAEGVKSVYEDTLNCSERALLAVADFDAVFPEKKSDELNKWIWRYSSRRAGRNIWYHGIVNRSRESDRAFARRRIQKRRMKLLEGVPLSFEINIYDDKVALCSTAEDMMGVIIQSADVAKSAKLLHAALWRLLPDYRP